MGKITHGYYQTPTWKSWQMMKSRCNNPRYSQYKDYGGRGITYDPDWEDFKNFLADMGERPKGKTLDRFPDHDGPYNKNNCRWATKVEQQRNRRIPLTSPYPGVSWQKIRGRWRAVTERVKEKRIILYWGLNLDMAIEARQFYESFILGD